jgi:hypothetical protein
MLAGPKRDRPKPAAHRVVSQFEFCRIAYRNQAAVPICFQVSKGNDVANSIQLAHFYRKEYGDAGYRSTPVLIDEIDNIEQMLSDALLDRFRSPRIRTKPPHTADLVTEGGVVILRLYVVTEDKVMKAVLNSQNA